jgi:hypothetical protein
MKDFRFGRDDDWVNLCCLYSLRMTNFYSTYLRNEQEFFIIFALVVSSVFHYFLCVRKTERERVEETDNLMFLLH